VTRRQQLISLLRRTQFVNHALGQLPERMRLAVHSFLAGGPMRQQAKQLGCTQARLRALQEMGLRELEDALYDPPPAPDE